MRLLRNLFKKRAAADLVSQGLRDDNRLSRKVILDSLQLFSGALGDSWREVSREAAAGMVLVALAKNSSLRHTVNATGWKLVLAFVGDHPELFRFVSPRAIADICAYRTAGADAFIAQAA